MMLLAISMGIMAAQPATPASPPVKGGGDGLREGGREGGRERRVRRNRINFTKADGGGRVGEGKG